MTSQAWVVVASDTPDERTVPVEGRLLVGRECLGADHSRCLILEDPLVSRDHFEIRTDATGGPILVDLSLNGTRVNGRRVESAEPIALRDGDRIELGATELRFCAPAAGVLRHSPAREAIHGDAINLAFRLAAMAAREGRPPVLVADDAAAAAPGTARYGALQQLEAKGRSSAASVRAAEPRA